MAEIVNLRRARKARARAAQDTKAAENRAKFGEAKPVRDLREARQRQEAERLAQHLRTLGKLEER